MPTGNASGHAKENAKFYTDKLRIKPPEAVLLYSPECETIDTKIINKLFIQSAFSQVGNIA